MTPPQRQAAPEATLGLQLVSWAGRSLRFAYRAARTWWHGWDWIGRFGIVLVVLGVALWLTGCPLFVSPLASEMLSGLGGIFCLGGALWCFADAWLRIRHPAPAPETVSRHEPPEGP